MNKSSKKKSWAKFSKNIRKSENKLKQTILPTFFLR